MCVCTVEIPLRTADIGEHVQGVSERGRFSGLRWNGDGFFETRARQIVLTHALEDLPAICQVARHRQFVVALTVDLERAVGDRESLWITSLMPAQQPDAAQDMALECCVVSL